MSKNDLTPAMRKVLKKLKRSEPRNAEQLGCSISTLLALNRRGLVWVEMGFFAAVYPRRAPVFLSRKTSPPAFGTEKGR